MALNLEFRIPTVPYGFVGVSFEAESPGDLKRAVLDCDSDLWTAVGDAYARAAGMAVIGKDLGGQVVGEHIDPSWPQEAQEAPAWGGYDQPPAPPAWAPQAPQSPPGVVAPSCAHGPAKLVPAGVSKSTGKPYNPFWACQAPRGQAKCQMPRYQG